MATAKKLPSGNYRCRASYTDENGNHITKSFTAPTKKEAEFKAAEFIMQRKHNSKPENKTVGDLIDMFIDSRINVLSPSTVVDYRRIRKNALQSIAKMRVGLLTHEKYQSAINEYAKTHAPKTVKGVHALFKKVLETNSIFIAEKINLPQPIKKDIVIPLESEVNEFLKNIEGTAVELFVKFAVYCGLRRSEIFALTWKDINLNCDNPTVYVHESKVQDEYGEYVNKTTKTVTSTRYVPIPPALANAFPEDRPPNSPVVPGTPASLDSKYDRARKKYNFNYKFHTLRHYYASTLLILGLPNKYAAQLMGHSTEEMLKRVYQHVFPDVQQQYMDAITTHFSK